MGYYTSSEEKEHERKQAEQLRKIEIAYFRLSVVISTLAVIISIVSLAIKIHGTT